MSEGRVSIPLEEYRNLLHMESEIRDLTAALGDAIFWWTDGEPDTHLEPTKNNDRDEYNDLVKCRAMLLVGRERSQRG